MNNQEAFDRCVQHLATMSHRSARIRENGKADCLYHNPVDDNRCAIGGIMPLDLAKALGDSRMSIHLIVEKPLVPEHEICVLFRDVDVPLLSWLQAAHDNAENWDESGFIGWGFLRRLVTRYDLDMTVLDEFSSTLETQELVDA